MPHPVERTLVFVKPRAVAHGHVGEIIGRFERAGLRISELQLLTLHRAAAEEHYAEHRDRPFFASLVESVTSGPIVAFVAAGDGAVATARKLCGATDPARADRGTIRRDFGSDICCNAIHASDSVQAAQGEIGRFFPADARAPAASRGA